MTTLLAGAMVAEDAHDGLEAVRAAFHEGGHLVGIFEGHGPLEDAAIWLEPGGGGSGIVRHGPDFDGGTWINYDQIPAQIVTSFAGAEAEALLLTRLLGWHPDDALAHAYGPSAVHDMDNVSRAAAHFQGALQLDRLAAQAAQMVSDYWDSIERLADALMEHGHLDAGQLTAVVYG